MGFLTIPGLDPIKAIVSTSYPSISTKHGNHRQRGINTAWAYDRMGSRSHMNKVTEVASFPYGFSFQAFYCREHRQIELVPSESARTLNDWYDAGLHPRFCTDRVLLDCKQLIGEASWGVRNGVGIRKWSRILNASKTPKEFIELVRPYLFSYFSSGGRRIRVEAWFKEKCGANAFTVKDFFGERNQERRRIMLRHGVSIESVVKGLKLVSEDEEGKLYDEMREEGTENQRAVARYLYVKCPSTGQEYLLAVPFNTWNRELNQQTNLDTPKIARRWTFRLRPEAEFVAEA